MIKLPQRKSAIKKVRQDKKRRAHNISIKTDLKKTVKSFNQLIAEKKTEEAKTALKKLLSKLDKACTKGIMHKNTAGRRKSSFMQALNRIA